MTVHTLDDLVKERRRELLRRETQRLEREARLVPWPAARWRVIREENDGLTVVFKPRPAGAR
jgi:hypothetical protein